MGRRFFLPVLLIFFTIVPAFPRGRKEKAQDETIHNDEWTLCITDLNVSSLPSSQQLLGGVLLRILSQSFRGVERRIRENDEIQYYTDYAWSKSRSEAAKALIAKQNERDLLIFKGDPEWRYLRNLKAIETDLIKLEEDIQTQKDEIPSVEAEPLLRINSMTGPWPAPPREGEEYRFCVAQKADAFLSGSVSEYHGRIYLTLRLYTLHTRSYSWEDEILFSSQDLNIAMSELTGRLIATVSGTQPAAIMVHVQPEDAMILIDNFFAGMGEMPLQEHVPGTVEIAAYAERHEHVVQPVDIISGEIAEIFINLTPLGLSSFTVDVPEYPGSSVYLGSLFLGNSPLSVELPEDHFSYISVETPLGETGSMVSRGSAPVRGTAEFVQSENSLVFSTGIPVSPEEERVAKARRNFYNAFGRFWIALPVSLFAIGMADTYINAHDYRSNMGLGSKAQTGSVIKTGAYGLIGAAAADMVYRIYRYLNTSNADADPIARFESPEAEAEPVALSESPEVDADPIARFESPETEAEPLE